MKPLNQTKSKDLVTFKTGKLDSNAAEENGKYPFFTCSNETFSINKFAFDTECVLLAGNNAAGVFPLKYYKGKFNAYQRTYVIEAKNPQKFNIKYFYYFLRPYLESFKQQATGATTKFLTIKILNNIDVATPPIETQKKIAAVLSAYDDLIENNKRRIALLEKMAEEIYREWFVRMRFPGYKETKFEKGVPVGWEIRQLEDLCSLIKRGVSPSYDDDSKYLVINQRCIRNGNIDLSIARSHNTRTSEEKLVKYGDTLINSTGVGTLGRVSIVEFEISDTTVDSHVTICRANTSQINIQYLSHTIKNLQQFFENMAVGSTGQTELGRKVIAKTEILVPDSELQEHFSNFTLNIWSKRRLLFSALDKLITTRDLLLSRLISGKLSVENLDIQFPSSMREEKKEELQLAESN